MMRTLPRLVGIASIVLAVVASTGPAGGQEARRLRARELGVRTGADGLRIHALPHDRLLAALRKYGRLK